MKLSRRSALLTTAAAAAASLAHRLDAADTASGLKGHINHSVCKWCYDKVKLEDLAKFAKELGMSSIELLEVKDIPTVNKYGLTCAMVSGVPGGITQGLNRFENHDKMVEWFAATAPEVVKVGCQNVICFSGNRDGLADEKGLEHCALGLKRIIGVAEKHRVTVVMELLNSKVNHKDYMCDRTPWGVELAKRIGSERFKLLYDIYHMQIMEGDVIRTLKENAAYIGHYHTAGNPGRNEFEPQDQQELNYPPIMRAIKATGFKGFVGQEFLPKRDPLTSLRAAVKLCAV